jgi:hypothetical protein
MSDAVQLSLLPGVDEPAGGTVKGYVPAIYCDEVSPTPRAMPDGWLITLPNGLPALAGEFVDEEDARALADGEIVKFLRLTEYGNAILTVDGALEYRTSRDMPSDATHVCADHDPDAMSDSVEQLVEQMDYKPGEYALAYYDWSGEIAYRLDAAGRRFVLAAV